MTKLISFGLPVLLVFGTGIGAVTLPNNSTAYVCEVENCIRTQEHTHSSKKSAEIAPIESYVCEVSECTNTSQHDHIVCDVPGCSQMTNHQHNGTLDGYNNTGNHGRASCHGNSENHQSKFKHNGYGHH